MFRFVSPTGDFVATLIYPRDSRIAAEFMGDSVFPFIRSGHPRADHFRSDTRKSFLLKIPIYLDATINLKSFGRLL